MIPPWLQAEAARLLGQMKPGLAKEIGESIDLTAPNRLEFAKAALRAAAQRPAVRAVLDRIAADLEVLAQAERERREGKR